MTTYNPCGMHKTSGLFSILGPGDNLSTGPNNNLVAAIFTQTADKTITNTTSETSAIGTGVGTLTLLANTLVAGSTIHIDGGGVYSAAAITPGNLTIKIKLGSTVIATCVLGALVSGATTLAYNFDAVLVFRSIGASGTVLCHGELDYNSGLGRNFGDLTNNGAVTTIDTTVDQILDVSVTWQTASVSNIVKNTFAIVEQVW